MKSIHSNYFAYVALTCRNDYKYKLCQNQFEVVNELNLIKSGLGLLKLWAQSRERGREERRSITRKTMTLPYSPVNRKRIYLARKKWNAKPTLWPCTVMYSDLVQSNGFLIPMIRWPGNCVMSPWKCKIYLTNLKERGERKRNTEIWNPRLSSLSLGIWSPHAQQRSPRVLGTREGHGSSGHERWSNVTNSWATHR